MSEQQQQRVAVYRAWYYTDLLRRMNEVLALRYAVPYKRPDDPDDVTPDCVVEPPKE